MVLFNYSTKELTAKIVYYGPGLCGKTTNLQFIFDNLPSNIHKGKMLSLATKTDRTLFFDFLPIDLGTIRGMRTRLQLYTVPGQVFYNTTRKLVLKGADGLVFVADSQKKMLDANIESFRNMEQNLREHGMDLTTIPHVLQFNKRDLKDILEIEKLNTALNRFNVPIYEAVATTGIGVQDTLKAVTRLVLNSLREKYADGRKPAARPAPAPPAPPPPAPRAEPVLEAEPEVEVAAEAEPILEAEPEVEVTAEAEPILEAEPEAEAEVAVEAEPAEEAEPVLELAEAEEEQVAAVEVAQTGVDSEPVLAMAEETGQEEDVPVLQVAEEAGSAAPEASPLALDEQPTDGDEAIEIIEEEEEAPLGQIGVSPPPVEAGAASTAEAGVNSALAQPLDDSLMGVIPEEEEPQPVELQMPEETGVSPIQESGPDGSTVAIDVSAAAGGPEARTPQKRFPMGAAQEATIPVSVEVQGQVIDLKVTVSVRVDRR